MHTRVRFPLKKWWRFPLWVGALATGAKSFRDNPLLGSRRLNAWGLHAQRVRLAHRLAWYRRKRLAAAVRPEWREQFDRQGFVLLPDFLERSDFEEMKREIFECDLVARTHQQGDTLTIRVPAGPRLLAHSPQIRSVLRDREFRALLAYVASTASPPIHYLQAILGGVADGPKDPQLELHADTFHPSMKAFLFLEDVPNEGRPLTYVAGSHRMTEERLRWERQRSINVLQAADVLSQRGSFRIQPDELPELGLPPETRFVVPANTLVVIDTCGFHARADSDQPSRRVELWSYCRRSPFLPWTGLSLLAWRPLAERQGDWLMKMIDKLNRHGLAKQHWKPTGPWNSTLGSG